jgi:hypothetical protein
MSPGYVPLSSARLILLRRQLPRDAPRMSRNDCRSAIHPQIWPALLLPLRPGTILPGVDLSPLGAVTCGVWTRADALLLTTDATIRAHLRDGYWQRLWPGTYTDAGSIPTPEQRAYAAVLASGGRHQLAAGPPVRIAAAGRTAARYWGFPLIDDDDPATGARECGTDDVHVRGGGRARTTASGELRRHDLVLRPGDLLRLPSGLVVTSPVRTLLHCASLLTLEALVCSLDDALHREVVTRAELEEAAAAHAGSPGAPAFRRALALADGRAESPAETLARLLLLPVLPGLEPQVRLLGGWGYVLARFDLGDRRARFAVEADGKRGHAGDMAAKDRRRDRTSRSHGWRTERVTWWELRRQQELVVREMLQAYEEHVRRQAA